MKKQKVNGVRPMKWHIFNKYNEPLCWNVSALEFNTREQAERFLRAAARMDGFESYEDYIEAYSVDIRECIFYYDGGHFDCSNKIPTLDINDEETLIDVE